MRFASFYAIAVGVLMLGQWGFFLLAGMVPELQTAPLEIGFHLSAEMLTAMALITAGMGTLRGKRWGTTLYLIAAGMLLYTVINSAGHFAQQGQWPFVGMFGMLLIGALVSLYQYSQTSS